MKSEELTIMEDGLLRALADFRFGPAEIDDLAARKVVDDATLVETIREAERVNGDGRITFFELITVAAFMLFAEHKADYTLVEVELLTGRHHQIRAQLSKIGCPIRGDLKYGARRSLPGGGISLHSRRVEFEHPVRREPVSVTAPAPADDNLWAYFENR